MMTSAETLESNFCYLFFSGVFNKYFLVIIKYSLVPNPNPNPKRGTSGFDDIKPNFYNCPSLIKF